MVFCQFVFLLLHKVYSIFFSFKKFVHWVGKARQRRQKIEAKIIHNFVGTCVLSHSWLMTTEYRFHVNAIVISVVHCIPKLCAGKQIKCGPTNPPVTLGAYIFECTVVNNYQSPHLTCQSSFDAINATLSLSSFNCNEIFLIYYGNLI